MKLAPCLKIEEELRDAIADAKKQWASEHEQATDRKGRPLLFSRAEMERAASKTPQPQLFDFSEITDEQFWNEAESQVFFALRGYAAHASNGGKLQRQLFADDAAQGFAFIDLCQKRFDVVLMNPPFGECSQLTESLLAHYYPDWNTNLLCTFIACAWTFTCAGGSVGVIYDRTASVKSTYEDFRRHCLLPDCRLSAVADLGWGVLDANVEVTTAVLHRRAADTSCFIDARAITTEGKGGFIETLVSTDHAISTKVWVRPRSFIHLPNAVLAYDFPEILRKAFAAYPSLESSGIVAAQGHALKSEVHYRAFWEISPHEPIGPERPWIGAFKGGDLQPILSKDSSHCTVRT